MEIYFDAVIVGGGASGLFAACILGEAGINTAILEKNTRVGKKLLSTGNGRCNLTSVENADDLDAYAQNYNDKKFVKVALSSFSVNDTLDYFHNLGLLTAEEDFCIYPATFSSSTVLDVLRQKLQKEKVSVFCDTEVSEILQEGGTFLVRTNNDVFRCKSLLMCGGGLARVKKNNCYDILKNLGVKITDCRPALLPVKCVSPHLKGLNGARARVKVSLLEKGKIIDTAVGEVLFKDNGLSGIVIFQLTFKEIKGREISLNLLPHVKNPFEMFEQRIKQNPNYSAIEIMTGVFSRQLGENVLSAAKIKPDEKSKNIDISALVNSCTNMVFSNLSLTSYDLCQVTKGGVELSQIDPLTMRHKDTKGLYICGELLDIHAKCGGYNLQFAWTSAALASKDIIQTARKRD